MAVEFGLLREQDSSFQPSMPLPLNPQPEQYTIPVTADAVKAFNDGYVTLLYMLAGYYGNYTPAAYNAEKKTHLLQALVQTMVAPAMTMLVRSLGELITHLPAEPHGGPAGPTFYLSPETLRTLQNPTDPVFLDLEFYTSSLQGVANTLQKVINEDDPPLALKPKFEYARQNVMRMIGNLEYIYQNGVFPKFDPSQMPSCPQDDNCG
jgi:hypothetical protein